MEEFTRPTFDEAAVAVVEGFLKGKRLEKFQESVRAVREGLAADGWVGNGAQKSTKGFGQGLVTKVHGGHHLSREYFEPYMALQFGSRCEVNASDEVLTSLVPKVPAEVARAWVKVCRDAVKVSAYLHALRPLPKVTEIGLSPRVTKTLTETSLAIDLPSIKPAKVKTRWVRDFDEKTGKPKTDRWGEPVFVPVPYIEWTPGTLFGKSRHVCGCEACGKHIPSGRYVAIEADCSKNGHVGLWVGADCAKSIFGVKDKGIEKP